MDSHRNVADSGPVGRHARARADRRDAHVGLLGIGTLACPACDVPVSPGPGPRSPSDRIVCPMCARVGRIREFLSMDVPSRPARVEVRLVERPARSRRLRGDDDVAPPPAA